MNKLYTGRIAHAFKDKKYFSILLPKGGYLVFKLNDSTKIELGDSISYYKEFGTNSMYLHKYGDWFSATVEAIEVSSDYVGSFNR
ncbi:MAG: hypothetical protein JST58_09650 [Bacteroidetes bacterium]|nr:hypothetical protein [Bacteroidota bacterium]